MGVIFLAAHVPFLAPSLEDIDSINFALGLRDFNPAEHQPHPPGYPIYIAVGRVSLAAVNAVRPALDRVTAEALALSLVSVVAGVLAILFAWRVFDLLARDAGPARPRVRFWATVFLAACPLFWMTGVRPLSDMPGLAFAFAAQALVLDGRLRGGAFLAGLALGARSQTLWLTAPLLALEMYRRSGPVAWRERAAAVLFAAVGALCWAIPLVVATGGIDAYMAALGTQAGEDFAHVDMLWANPTPRRLAFGLLHTLVLPWASAPLAAVMLGLAAIGIVVMAVHELRTRTGNVEPGTRNSCVVSLLVAFVPYAVFHLVFQETVTIRYALPVVVPMAFAAARTVALAGVATNVVALPVAVVSLMVAVPGAMRYAAAPHPAFRALADVQRRAEVEPPAMLTTHFELRRPMRAVEPTGLPVTYAPRQCEWMELVTYWAGGGRAPVWFLANPRRTDLDLIDRHSRRDVVRYRWTAEDRPEVGGTRPAAVDWYRLRPPAWFLGEGWSLTPETGGVAQATEAGLDRKPILGYVRRYAGPMHVLVGGQHLGGPTAGGANLEMSVDDVVIDRWTVQPNDPWFLRFVDLPQGVSGPEGYATLRIRASAAGSPGSEPDPQARVPPVAIRQFDIQPVSRPIAGFGSGWHEEEYDNATGLRWRWASDRAVLRVRAQATPIRIRLEGESPLKYFDAAPMITVSAGGRVIDRLQPVADWTWEVVVPPDALAASHGEVTVAASRVFIPAEVVGSPDTRRLSLRIFRVDIDSAR